MPRLRLAAVALALSAAVLPARAPAQRSLASVSGLTSLDGTGVSCSSDIPTAWQDGARAGWLDCLQADPTDPLFAGDPTFWGGLTYDVLASGPPAAYHFNAMMELANYTRPFASISGQVGYGDIVWWDDPRIATMEVLPSFDGFLSSMLTDPVFVDPSRVTTESYATVSFAGSAYPTQPGIPSNDFSCTTNAGTLPLWSHSAALGAPGDVTVDWTLDRDTPLSCQSNTTDAGGRRGLAFKTYVTATMRMHYDQEFDGNGDPLPVSMLLTADFSNTSLLALRFRDARGNLIDDPNVSTLSGLTYAVAPPGAGPTAAVPEPATVALVGAGAALLLPLARRRRRTTA
jgi:hypothetical protein